MGREYLLKKEEAINNQHTPGMPKRMSNTSQCLKNRAIQPFLQPKDTTPRGS
jgi:hypothetical protein